MMKTQYIKAQTIKVFGNVCRTQREEITKNYTVGKPEKCVFFECIVCVSVCLAMSVVK